MDVRLSAVVVTHNSTCVVGECLRAARAALPEAELIVVDNASTDGTLDVCAALGGVRVLANDRNVGYGRACNQGAEAAAGTNLLFVNPDVQIVSADLAAARREAGPGPHGLVAPEMLGRDGRIRPMRHWTFDVASHVLGPLWPRELPMPRTPRLCRGQWWPPGALLLVDRAEFLRLGGFDRRFFLYYEDQDLARRYRAAGLPIRLTAMLCARHDGGSSSTGDGAGATARDGWSYLSWLQYVSTWKGRRTAIRAARAAILLRGLVLAGLGLVDRIGPLASRAHRKRMELLEMNEFVLRQSRPGAVAGEMGFCPQARAIVAEMQRAA
ncbi:MAG: glycosyltransferase family 2 protein [Actinobacteria bacterium]|nr:glycosyltransferase family 2 protein [Actinomycetota bacterium]